MRQSILRWIPPSRIRERILMLVLLVVGLVSLAADSYARRASAANGDPGFPTGGTIYAQGYNRDRQTARFRPGLTVADSNSLATTLTAALAASPSQLFQLNGRPTLMVSCRFATSSSNTCKVRVAFVYYDGTSYYFLGLSQELQANASAIQDQAYSGGAVAGYFMAPDLLFDGHGATHALVLLTVAPTGGGAVDFWVGSE